MSITLSQQERYWRPKFDAKKDVFFAPVVRGLAAAEVKPQTITLLGICALITGLLVSWGRGELVWLLIGMWGQVTLDALDGPLARYTNTQSAAGSRLDAIADNGTFAVAALALSAWNLPGPALSLPFIMTYFLVVGLTAALNKRGTPFYVVMRPRFVYFAAVTLDVTLATSTTIPLVGALTIGLAIFSFFGLLNLRYSA